jgi:hypothetical protein|tara:strand:+ start:59 stop:259 length:201 start_codon:yes stop_codon:yes gene_type:complete
MNQNENIKNFNKHGLISVRNDFNLNDSPIRIDQDGFESNRDDYTLRFLSGTESNTNGFFNLSQKVS